MARTVAYELHLEGCREDVGLSAEGILATLRHVALELLRVQQHTGGAQAAVIT